MKYLLFFALLFSQTAFAQPNYKRLDSLLQKHVNAAGKVNYKLLKTNKAELIALADDFKAKTPEASWSKNVQLAYWLNAYNLFTLKLIVDNYPLKSIMNLDGGKTWDVKRIELGGKKYSLNEIENEIIRPKFKDPRIHFAVNCAAKSCPPLHNEAFTAENVQSLLDKRTRKFIRSSANTLAGNSVKVSKIFEWYSSDFGSLIDFLNKYANVKIAADAKIEYAEYDWGLNE